MATSRDLIIKILADTKDLAAGVNKAEGALGKLKTAAVAVGGAYAATKVVDFLGDATKAAEEDAKSQRLLATQIRDTTSATDDQIAGVEKFIGKLSRATGVADDDLRPAYAALVRATGDVDLAQGELATSMDIAAGRGVDLETVTKAMEKAHLGNVTALGKLGLATKDAEGNTLSLEQIMAQASVTYQGAAAAAITPSERWNVAVSELKESIGAKLLPVMNKLAEVGSTILAWFDGLDPKWQMAIEGAVGLAVAGAVLTVAVGALSTAFGALTAVLAILTSPVTLVIVAIAALAAGLIYAYTHCQEFRDVVDGTIDAVGAAISGFVSTTTSIWEHWGDDILRVARIAWETISGIVKTQINIILAVVQPLIDIVHGDWGKAWDDFRDRIKGVWEGIKTIISGQVDAILGIVGGMINAVKAAVNVFIRLWNNLDFTMPKVHIPGTDFDIGGFTIGLPHIASLATGGTVEKTGLAVVHEGETFSGVGRNGGRVLNMIVTGPVYVQMTGQYEPDKVAEAVQRHAQSNSGIRIPNGVITV